MVQPRSVPASRGRRAPGIAWLPRQGAGGETSLPRHPSRTAPVIRALRSAAPPAANSRLSVAAHSMVPDTGSAKTAASVLRCLLFITAGWVVLAKNASMVCVLSPEAVRPWGMSGAGPPGSQQIQTPMTPGSGRRFAGSSVRCSTTIWVRRRIASPELFPTIVLLHH